MSIPIFSPFSAAPVAVETVVQAGRAKGFSDRESYPQLPWQMEELPGTAWRNVSTGSQCFVIRLEESSCPWGTRLRPVIAVPCGRGAWLDSLGFWWGDHYLVEHWMRVDHWPASDQLPWFGLELRHCRHYIVHLEQQLASIQEHWDTVSCPVENSHSLQQQAQSYRQEVERVVARLRAFAELHHLVIPLDLLNSGLLHALQPTQLTLL